MAELATISLFSDANLLHYYRLEDVSDNKGSSNLTNNNTVAFNPAKYTNGADFGASNPNKYLSRTDAIGITNATNWAVPFWVKLQTEIGAGNYTFFNINFPTSSYCQLYYSYNAGTRRLVVDQGGGGPTYNITLGTANFYHMVMMRNGANVYLYINGTQVASGALGTAGGGLNTFGIGADGAGSNPSSAIIDDLGVFNRYLTDAEILTLYKEQSGFLAIL